MNTIKKLKENITDFLNEIAAHYGIPKSEIGSSLREINFYSLYQTLCREAMPVYVYRTRGDNPRLLRYSGEKIFPCNAINLYRLPDYAAENTGMSTAHFMEVWLREDLTIAITTCFHTDNTLYDKESSKLLDGGQIDTPEQHIYSICLTVCNQYGLDGYKVSYAPLELAESLREAQYQSSEEELRNRLIDHVSQEDASAWKSAPEQQIDVPQPDPYYTQQQLRDFGYKAPDMLPISTDFALELMERDVPVYMLHSDNTEAMAFDSEDIAMHIGMLGVTTQDWNDIREKPDILALQQQFAVSYQQTTAAPKRETILARENHLRNAEMSMEDDYGMIDGIINNGKSDRQESPEKKPSVVEKLKSTPRQPHRKSTPKKSNEKEL